MTDDKLRTAGTKELIFTLATLHAMLRVARGHDGPFFDHACDRIEAELKRRESLAHPEADQVSLKE